MKRSVLRQIKSEKEEVLNGAGIGEDCAIFSFAGQYITSCMQEAVIRLKSDTEDIKYGSKLPLRIADPPSREPEYDAEPRITIAHLIKRCANNLAAAGSQPVAVMLTLLLPQTLEEPDLKAFMLEAEEICKELSISIAGGQTRVLGRITAPIAVVTGFGTLPLAGEDTRHAAGDTVSNAGHTSGNATPGQDIVVSKWIGLEGTALLARRYREDLLSRYPACLVDEAACFDRYLSVIPEAAAAAEFGACAMHDVSEGGIFAALWELAESAGVGLTVDIRKLPLRQETVEICERCNVNPYELLSGGSLIMTAEDGHGLTDWLRERQIPAVVVGKVTDSNDRLILNGDEVRYMDRPKRDEIYRMFQDS